MPQTTKAVRRKYNVVASLYDKVLPFYIRKTIRKALELITLKDASHIIDIGCGTGELEKALIQKNPSYRMIGVDLSEDMLAQARSKMEGNPNVSFKEGDFINIDLASNDFDAAFSLSNLHYFPHPHLIFKKAFHLLKPGGVFVLIDWNRNTFRGKIYNAYMRFADPAFVKAYTPQEVTDLLKREGFKVEYIHSFWVGLRWHLMRIVARKH